MGVYAMAYSNLALTEPHEHGDCDTSMHFWAGTYAAHALTAAGLADADVVSESYNTRWVAARCYETTEATKSLEIFSMSYGGYGVWRELLAEAVLGRTPEDVWQSPDPKLPFVEIVNFADNEGSIGPTAAARLLEDFSVAEYRQRYEEAVREHGGRNGWLDLWDRWVDGLTLAADNGMIRYG